ncbi:hypothetical protein EW145_g3996 [Phellinidium pouzarii]|uniref:Uncharacterized protein n=1 Tax=Phellinidium pouzarii TaxID=167371 RepID=A0A4S4L6Y5_9AGAM|nr:hypothetical protein EW145_g3996 [Phellinidium pouzarii]
MRRAQFPIVDYDERDTAFDMDAMIVPDNVINNNAIGFVRSPGSPTESELELDEVEQSIISIAMMSPSPDASIDIVDEAQEVVLPLETVPDLSASAGDVVFAATQDNVRLGEKSEADRDGRTQNGTEKAEVHNRVRPDFIHPDDDIATSISTGPIRRNATNLKIIEPSTHVAEPVIAEPPVLRRSVRAAAAAAAREKLHAGATPAVQVRSDKGKGRTKLPPSKTSLARSKRTRETEDVDDAAADLDDHPEPGSSRKPKRQRVAAQPVVEGVPVNLSFRAKAEDVPKFSNENGDDNLQLVITASMAFLSSAEKPAAPGVDTLTVLEPAAPVVPEAHIPLFEPAGFIVLIADVIPVAPAIQLFEPALSAPTAITAPVPSQVQPARISRLQRPRNQRETSSSLILCLCICSRLFGDASAASPNLLLAFQRLTKTMLWILALSTYFLSVG